MPFRFDREAHEYVREEDGVVLPHITGLLKAAGLVNDRWYTEEGNERGRMVHATTCEYDIGHRQVLDDDSPWRNYLLGYVKALGSLEAVFTAIEEPFVHPRYQFGGRPDRVGSLLGAVGVLEIKTGAVEGSHQIQTALQAILVAPDVRLPETSLLRYCLYLKASGKFLLLRHDRRADFDVAHRIIQTYRPPTIGAIRRARRGDTAG